MNQAAGKINYNANWFFICLKSPGSTPWNDFIGALKFDPGMIGVMDITANQGTFPVQLNTDVNTMDVSVYCTAPDDESQTLAVFSFASAKNASGTPSIIFKRWVQTPDVIVYSGTEPNIEFRIDNSNHGFQVANFRQNQYTLLGSVTPGILEYDIIEDDTETPIFTGRMSFTMEYSNT